MLSVYRFHKTWVSTHHRHVTNVLGEEFHDTLHESTGWDQRTSDSRRIKPNVIGTGIGLLLKLTWDMWLFFLGWLPFLTSSFYIINCYLMFILGHQLDSERKWQKFHDSWFLCYVIFSKNRFGVIRSPSSSLLQYWKMILMNDISWGIDFK